MATVALRMWLLASSVLSLALAAGCAGGTAPAIVAAAGELPAGSGLVFGQVRATWRYKGEAATGVAWRHQATGERFERLLDKDGSFAWVLPGGRHEVRSIWSGRESIDAPEGAGLRFVVIPGTALYVGHLTVVHASPGARGEISVEERLPDTMKHLRSHHPGLAAGPVLIGLMYWLPRTRLPVVDVVLNERVVVPLIVDTGATSVVVTRRTAAQLGSTDLDALPRKEFLTAGGPVVAGMTRLASVRTGTVGRRDVEAAVDLPGHLPVGLLGASFLRYFKVTIDGRGGVGFEALTGP